MEILLSIRCFLKTRSTNTFQDEEKRKQKKGRSTRNVHKFYTQNSFYDRFIRQFFLFDTLQCEAAKEIEKDSKP